MVAILEWGVLLLVDRPFPSSLVPLFQNESSCKTFQMKMSFICMKMNLQVEDISIWMVSHGDSLWQRQKATRKWPIAARPATLRIATWASINQLNWCTLEVTVFQFYGHVVGCCIHSWGEKRNNPVNGGFSVCMWMEQGCVTIHMNSRYCLLRCTMWF